jgi:hypothetical protein
MGDRRTIEKRIQRAWRINRSNYRQHEAALNKAAERFGLDLKDADQCELLLYKLADVLFGPDGKKGRPTGSSTSWNSTRLRSLGAIYEEKRYENPKLSDAKIANLIKDEHEKFKNDDAEQIRQRLRWAEEVYKEWIFDYAMDEAHIWAREHGEIEDEDFDDWTLTTDF